MLLLLLLLLLPFAQCMSDEFIASNLQPLIIGETCGTANATLKFQKQPLRQDCYAHLFKGCFPQNTPDYEKTRLHDDYQSCMDDSTLDLLDYSIGCFSELIGATKQGYGDLCYRPEDFACGKWPLPGDPIPLNDPRSPFRGEQKKSCPSGGLCKPHGFWSVYSINTGVCCEKKIEDLHTLFRATCPYGSPVYRCDLRLPSSDLLLKGLTCSSHHCPPDSYCVESPFYAYCCKY